MSYAFSTDDEPALDPVDEVPEAPRPHPRFVTGDIIAVATERGSSGELYLPDGDVAHVDLPPDAMPLVVVESELAARVLDLSGGTHTLGARTDGARRLPEGTRPGFEPIGDILFAPRSPLLYVVRQVQQEGRCS